MIVYIFVANNVIKKRPQETGAALHNFIPNIFPTYSFLFLSFGLEQSSKILRTLTSNIIGTYIQNIPLY